MPISLTQTHEDWITSRVAAGEFKSVEDGVRQLLDESIAERGLEEDDLAWAKPLIDEGLAELANGNVVSVDEFNTHIADVLSGRRRG